MDWIFPSIAGVAVAIGTWFVKRAIGGIDSKIEATEAKVVKNSQHHFEKEESLNVRVAVLEERTRKM